MKYQILHQSRGRIRLRLGLTRMSVDEADRLEAHLAALPHVRRVTVFERTCDVVIFCETGRKAILADLAAFTFRDVADMELPSVSSRAVTRQYQEKLVKMVVFRVVRKLFVPFPIRRVWCILRSIPFLRHGLHCIRRRQMKVELLDAISIGVSLLRGDFLTASSVMFLLRVSELLEEWTRKKALNDLARCMSLNVDRVWLMADGQEVLVPVGQVKVGDTVCVHTGSVIPMDGRVISGESSVNQASLTGESVAVRKGPGAAVYAGTVVEEGECLLEVTQQAGSSRYDQIVTMIEESEKLKSATENRALALADRLVPWSLLGTVTTYALTRNITRAISILMVDFSCALKLSMPLAVLSAMRECGYHHITVKGGKYLEAVARADTIVFDKTGTLTYATPSVAEVIAFNGWEEEDVLRLAACLEEHYPHSMANAVVRAAAEQGIIHEENHTKIEYVVAHGIASRVGDTKVLIGSYHFVFEDEQCIVPGEETEKFQSRPDQYSHLYLAAGGVLVGIICIADPLRREAAQVLGQLRALGISKAVMMTGDNERTAAAIARQVGVDSFHAGVLPEDKANFVKAEKAAGRTVIMIGDGINDSPALSAADVGIAISDGAAIAREIADITISADSLWELVLLKKIANGLRSRIAWNYRFVLGFNGALIGMGAMGLLMPAASALAHNLSTLAISLKSMTNLVDVRRDPTLLPEAADEEA